MVGVVTFGVVTFGVVTFGVVTFGVFGVVTFGVVTFGVVGVVIFGCTVPLPTLVLLFFLYYTHVFLVLFQMGSSGGHY
jgi:hypothetical protein